MKLTKGTYKAGLYACRNFHYSKAMPNGSYIYNVWNDNDEWCGVIVYGVGANKCIASPYDKWQGQVLELERVALNGKQGHNTTAQAVAISLKLLKKEAPWVDLIVSYADLDQDHYGTLYQAGNWIYTGIMNANNRGAFIIHGKKMHPKSVYSRGWKESLLWLRENIDKDAEEFVTLGKHKYLMPMTKAMRERIQVLKKDYPKK